MVEQSAVFVCYEPLTTDVSAAQSSCAGLGDGLGCPADHEASVFMMAMPAMQLKERRRSRRTPGRYRHVIPYSSILWPFSPSYGHSLDKTARSVGGWSTRQMVDRHYRMTLDGKGRRR